MKLSEETRQRIDEIITRYPQKRSASLPLLHLVQEEEGCVSDEAIEWIAEKLELQPINILELVTFYPMFRRVPPGRRHIRICRTLSCALNGAYQVCETMRKEFNCGLNETSEDGEVTLEFVECLAACGSGPVALLDDELIENIDQNRVREIVRQIRDEQS